MACGDWAEADMLTQNSEKGLGGLDRHGEERAGVQAFVWQADVTDSDGELLRRGSHQLDSVVPQSWVRKENKEPQRKQRQKTELTNGQIHAEFSDAVIHLLFRWPLPEQGQMHCAFSYFK